jgi:menaquinone-dependent protoporphyrinogen oxidase
MSKSILVAYATRYGSTQETAESIAQILRELEYETDLAPMRQVRSLEKYDGVVMGAPLQMFKWHGDAHHFVERYRRVLPGLPVAVFALGPLHREEKEMQEARAQLDKELAKHAWFQPREIQIIVGRLDPTKLHFPFSLFANKMPASDEMDWEAIRAWAKRLPEILQLETSAPEPVFAGKS